MVWVLGLLIAAIVVTLVLVFVRRPEKARSAEVRKRYALEVDGAKRIPLAADRPSAPPAAPLAEIDARGVHAGGDASRTGAANWLVDLVREDPSPLPPIRPPASGIGGQIVRTPDGEAVITTPPFALRTQMLTTRLGRFINRLSGRLPAWMIACPRVRLDSLVTPTPPDGRDPDDWSQWRRRVRLRAVDVVICDRRSWRPILAITLQPVGRFGRGDSSNGRLAALAIGGGRDRMIDEVLAHVGLPLVVATGHMAEDWKLIAPYVEQAILRGVSEEEIVAADDARARPDPDAAVNLLRMDADKGWLLE